MPKISLSGPAELLTVIPFHLGFQPTRSVVVVCFHGKRLGLVARLDLVDPALVVEAADQTIPTLLQGSPSSVAVVGYEDERDESVPLLEALAAGVESSGVVVRERLAVHDGRWRSVGCDCCPDEGWLLPEQAAVPAVASYVALGHTVLADRHELGRLVEPLAPSEPRHALAVAAIDDWQRRWADAAGGEGSGAEPSGRRRRRRGRDDVRLGVLDGGNPTPRQFLVNDSLVAWGGVLHGEIEGYGIEHWLPSLVGPLRDVRVRDALVGWLCPGTGPGDDVPDELAVLLEVFLGPELRLAPASGEEDDHAWVGEALGARLPATDREALRALRALLADTGSSGDEETTDERWTDERWTDERWTDERWTDEAWTDDASTDGPRLDDASTDEEPGDAWDDWEGATTPRLLLSRLEQVCRLTPAVHAAPLLSVVASVAWWSGDGARAGVAVDRALELEPEHRLSLLLRGLLDRGVRPRRCA